MRKVIILLIFLQTIVLAAFAHPVLRQLQQVNQYWNVQNDIAFNILPSQGPSSSTEWIQLHLSLVESTLRNRDVSGLTEQQRVNRTRCLDYLHEYWQGARFPQNDICNYRTPIFIDRYDNFCAVGYLVKASGYEHVSRRIAARTNLAYVHEMDYPELDLWAKEHGFSKDELAWIQPSYSEPPLYTLSPIPQGVNGEVNTLFTDHEHAIIYVGGSFRSANFDTNAKNIAYLTDGGAKYNWHNMGNGVNGPVHAIAKHDKNIFVAGSFTQAGNLPVKNIVRWNGAKWIKADCLDGIVKDLKVFAGKLFAAGHFSLCNDAAEVNFAWWSNRVWIPISGLTGTVNTMEAVGEYLFLGGDFSYEGQKTNLIRWHPELGFKPFENTTPGPIHDFEIFHDTVFAGSTFSQDQSVAQSAMVYFLKGETWAEWPLPIDMNSRTEQSVFTLFTEGDSLFFGGNFYISEPRCMHLYRAIPTQEEPHIYAMWRGSVRSSTQYKHEIIIGGNFTAGNGMVGTGLTAENIARKTSFSMVNVASTSNEHLPSTTYPNPASSGGVIRWEGSQSGAPMLFKLYDIQGKEVWNQQTSEQSLQLPMLPPGLYLTEMIQEGKAPSVGKLIIE